MVVRIITGHVLDRLRELPVESVHCVVTSPPYYGLRDYKIPPQVWGGHEKPAASSADVLAPNVRPAWGATYAADPPQAWGGADWCGKNPGGHVWRAESVAAYSSRGNGQQATGGCGRGNRHRGDLNSAREKADSEVERAFCLRCRAWRGSLGLEPTLALYLDHMVEVCREIRRVLRKDGTLWLNIGDSYAGGGPHHGENNLGKSGTNKGSATGRDRHSDLKPKDLMLIPSRLVIRLQEDGWWVRSEIIWAKRSPMPESCTDRPTSAHEKVFLLTKSAKYFYDAEAVKEEVTGNAHERGEGNNPKRQMGVPGMMRSNPTFTANELVSSRHLRNVWHLGPSPFPEAHFATFSPEIPRRAILAGCPKGGVVLDPFLGAGTTALVADRLGRDCIGIELNEEYVAMAKRRILDDAGMFADLQDAAD